MNPAPYSGKVGCVFDKRNLVIGAYMMFDGQCTDFFEGIIDEVAVFKEALSAGEIRQHYNQGRPN